MSAILVLENASFSPGGNRGIVATPAKTVPILVLTKMDAAKSLSITPRHLDNLVAAGMIRPIRFVEGGHPMFVVSHLRRLVNKLAAETQEATDKSAAAGPATQRPRASELPETSCLLLSRRDAARMLGISIAKFSQIVTTGELRQVRLVPGGDPQYRADDLAELVERKTEANGGEPCKRAT
jgi:hypothetical protein